MTTMTLDQAKNHLEELLAKAAEGGQVEIVREDGATFVVVATQAPPRKKRGLIGSGKGKLWMADDVDDTPDGFERYLGGSSAATAHNDAGAPSGESDAGATPIQRRPRSEMFGVLKGKIWIAPDFDDIPEGFEPYLGDDYEKGK